MNSINEYVLLIRRLLEEPRNELIKKDYNKYEEIINEYDKELLLRYKKIEKMLNEETEDN